MNVRFNDRHRSLLVAILPSSILIQCMTIVHDGIHVKNAALDIRACIGGSVR